MKTRSLIFPATEKPESSLYDRDREHAHLHDFIVVDAVVSHSAYRLLQSAANAIAHRHRSPSTGGSNSSCKLLPAGKLLLSVGRYRVYRLFILPYRLVTLYSSGLSSLAAQGNFNTLLSLLLLVCCTVNSILLQSPDRGRFVSLVVTLERSSTVFSKKTKKNCIECSVRASVDFAGSPTSNISKTLQLRSVNRL
ncbi:hypothetical protein AGLY_014706, partial [Aphis glycines]